MPKNLYLLSPPRMPLLLQLCLLSWTVLQINKTKLVIMAPPVYQTCPHPDWCQSNLAQGRRHVNRAGWANFTKGAFFIWRALFCISKRNSLCVFDLLISQSLPLSFKDEYIIYKRMNKCPWHSSSRHGFERSQFTSLIAFFIYIYIFFWFPKRAFFYPAYPRQRAG